MCIRDRQLPVAESVPVHNFPTRLWGPLASWRRRSHPMTEMEMPDMFDKLTAQVEQWAEIYPEPPEFELASDRELTRTDAAHRVEVTMKDFKVASVHIDDTWYTEWLPSLLQIEQAAVSYTHLRAHE